MRLKGPLDFESKGLYRGFVSVKDGGEPSLSTQCELQVSVSDVNDHHPSIQITLRDGTVVSEEYLEVCGAVDGCGWGC